MGAETKRRPTPPVTHYCDWDAPGRLVVRALCNAIIKRKQHRNDPSCSTCQAVLRRRETEIGPA